LVFLSFPQGSHPVHSFCTSGECFSVAGCNLLLQSGFSENVGISQRLPNDDCGDAGGSWQFSRVNCQGKFGNARECEPVARALRPPPLPALRSGLGCWPPHRLHRYDSPNHSSATVLVKVALTCGRCRTSTVGSPPLSGGKARGEIHERCGSGGWPGPHLFFALTSYSPFVLLQ